MTLLVSYHRHTVHIGQADWVELYIYIYIYIYKDLSMCASYWCTQLQVANGSGELVPSQFENNARTHRQILQDWLNYWINNSDMSFHGINHRKCQSSEPSAHFSLSYFLSLHQTQAANFEKEIQQHFLNLIHVHKKYWKSTCRARN